MVLTNQPKNLSQNQMQALLQYLYHEREEVRCDAIQQTRAQQWQHEQLTEALTELAVLDEAAEVRAAAREALRALIMEAR